MVKSELLQKYVENKYVKKYWVNRDIEPMNSNEFRFFLQTVAVNRGKINDDDIFIHSLFMALSIK